MDTTLTQLIQELRRLDQLERDAAVESATRAKETEARVVELEAALASVRASLDAARAENAELRLALAARHTETRATERAATQGRPNRR